MRFCWEEGRRTRADGTTFCPGLWGFGAAMLATRYRDIVDPGTDRLGFE